MMRVNGWHNILAVLIEFLFYAGLYTYIHIKDQSTHTISEQYMNLISKNLFMIYGYNSQILQSIAYLRKKKNIKYNTSINSKKRRKNNKNVNIQINNIDYQCPHNPTKMITSLATSNNLTKSFLSSTMNKYKSMYQYTQSINQDEAVQALPKPDPYIEQKQFISKWFSLNRQQRRSYSWENKYIYKLLLPLFYPDIEIQQLLIPQNQLHDKFNKFFTSVFKVKIIKDGQKTQNLKNSIYNQWTTNSHTSQQQQYNMSQTFILNLNRKINVQEVCKKSIRIQQKNKKMTPILYSYSINSWTIVNNRTQANQYIKILAVDHTQNNSFDTQILYTDRSLINRYKSQLLKQDFDIKKQIINNFLFCGLMPALNFNICISTKTNAQNLYSNSWRVIVQKYWRGQTVKQVEEKLYILLQGSVIEQVTIKQPKQNNVDNPNIGQIQKWKFQLARGSLLCHTNLKKILKNISISTSSSNNNFLKKKRIQYHQNKEQVIQYTSSYICQADTKFLSISYEDFIKILKNQKNVRRELLQRIHSIEENHMQVIAKSKNAQKVVKQSQTEPIEINYSIPHNKKGKKSKVFRRRTQQSENDYEEFLTYDRYEKITQNKENVSKKHLIYSQLNNLLRDKEKQERFIKKMHTQKGMKEIKKCQYEARLKQNKIQHLALKQSITHTEKYRNQPHEIKFIFEQEIMEKYMKSQNKNREKQSEVLSIPNTRRPQKYISMMALEVGRSEQSIKNVFDDKLSVDGGTKKFLKFHPDSRFYSRKSSRFGAFCQSSPNLQCIQGSKKLLKVGSTAQITFKKEQNRWV